MILADLSYYNHEFREDNDTKNDNDDYPLGFYMSIDNDENSSTFGAITDIQGLSGWQEFLFVSPNPDENGVVITDETIFSYERDVRRPLSDDNPSFSFDRSGLDVKLFVSDNSSTASNVEVVIAFGGTDPANFDGLKDVEVDIALSRGEITDQAIAAIYYTQQAMKALDDKYGPGNYTIEYTGHSLGGNVASTVASYFGGESHVFNSAPQADQVIDASTPDGMSGNAISAYEDKFPALILNNIDLNQVNVNDYHLTNDALRTMSRVDAEVAQQISNAIDNYTAPLVLGVGGFIASVSTIVPQVGAYLASGIGIGSVAAIKLLGLDTLDTEPFGPDDYFTNYANYQTGQSGAVDLGASVPFDVLENVVGDIVADPQFIDVASAGILYNMALTVVNLHLGSHLLFMLDNQDFSSITADEKLPWFWVEAFNENTTNFKSAALRTPDAPGETLNPNDDASFNFYKELERTKVNDPNGDGNVGSFKSQITLLADANLDNLILADSSNIGRETYNVIETVVQRAITQHTRNQMDNHTPDNVDIVTDQNDGLLTVDLSLLDDNLLGVEDYQVESLLATVLATRDREDLSENAPIIQDSVLLEYDYIYGLQSEKDSSIIEFINSGETAKLFLDGGNNSGVNFVMDQMENEQTITVTGGGADTIETNEGSNLIFSGAGDDVITQHVEKSSTEAIDGDLIYTGQGSDTVYGSFGFSYINGAESLKNGVSEVGLDTINYSNIDVSVYIQAGSVARKGFAGSFGVDELISIENYILTDQNDRLFGYDGLLDNTTKVDGGDGFDILDFSLAQNGVTVAVGSSLAISGFEEVIGTELNDVITGDGLNNRLFGNSGTDYVYANGGDDIIVGGLGSDFLYGGAGDDTYHFSKATELPLWQQIGSDFISDSSGANDQIVFSGGYQFNPNDYSVLGGALIISTDITVDVADQIEDIIYSDGAHFDIDRLINDEGAATTGNLTDDGNGYYFLDGDGSSNSLNATFATGTVNGYAGDDWLYSTSSQNLLLGGYGSDYLFGAGVLNGEQGNDYLDGQDYDDVIYIKSSGIDVIKDSGERGNLVAVEQDENGDDIALNYTLWKADNDSLVLDFSESVTSADVYASDNKTIILDYFSGGGIEFINGNAIDTSFVRHLFSSADEVLEGTDGVDILNGGQGNDLISAGAGDEVYVSAGQDKIELSSNVAQSYTVYFPEGTSVSSIIAYRDVSEAETIYFAHDDGEIGITAIINPPTLDFSIEGTREVNDFTLLTDGSYEDDEITDFVYSDFSGNLDTTRSQDDVIYGRGGDDEIDVFNGGIDFVYGGEGDDVITQYELPSFSTSGTVFFYGESGNDTLSTLTIAGELYGGAGDDVLISNDMTDKLDGGFGDDWISAGNGSDDIYGGDGNDIILGLVGGAKTVDGGAGNDLVVVDSTGDDIVSGGDGFDTISFEDAFGFSNSQIDLSQQTANINSTSYVFSGFEGVIGSYGDDTITGTVDSDVLDGGTGFEQFLAGNDTLSGGAGDDKYVFGTPFEVRLPPNQTPPANNLTVLVGDDVVSDSEGNDTIEFTEYVTLSSLTFTQSDDDLVITFDEGSVTILDHFANGEIENLLLSNGNQLELQNYNSWLIGTEASETLIGGSGNDVLGGGIGDDTLNGGAGDDTYLFNVGDGTNTITDNSGFDVISLGSGLSLSDITFNQVGNDLDIQIASGFLVKDFYSGDMDKVVEEIRFADGSTFDLTTLLTTTPESPEAINIASTGFNSYSDNQDAGGVASLIYSATGAALDGNAWKKIVVPMQYDVTSDTYITFEYKSTIEGEIQGFGLDDDDDYDTGPQPFKLFGTQSGGSTFIDDYEYTGAGDWQYFSINVGAHQTGAIDYLTFINDHDAQPQNGNGYYRNVVLYERDPGTINVAPQAVIDEFEGAIDTNIVGNLFEDNFHGLDFDVDNDALNAVAETINTTNGSVTILGNGGFTYTPDTGFSGTDSFIYTLEDSNGASDTVTATLFVGTTDADETFTTSSIYEHYNGGAGVDLVDYSTSATRVKLNLGAGIGWGGDANDDTFVHVENVIGTDISGDRDFIYGSESDNHIWGLAGNDQLEGMGGADTIDGGSGSDYANYGRSDAAVTVNLKTNVHTSGDAEGDNLISIENITGSDYDDDITGSDGGNKLYAGSGDDLIYGGAGNDTLYGENGADTFIYGAIDTIGYIDTIDDFSLSEGDMLDLSDVISSYDPVTDAITDFIQITDSGNNSIVSVDADGGADNFVHIATLNDITGLTDEAALEISGNLITV